MAKEKLIEYNPNESFEEALKAIEKYVVFVSEEERFDLEFIDPSSWFIINASGQGVYFKTSSQAKAQKFSDKLYGVGLYKARKVVRASIR